MRYRTYVFVLLMLVCLLGYLDRQVINILAESIRTEFNLKDWQIGALTGLAFALLYSGLSIPLARLADRTRRSPVIIVSLAVWSLFTMTCGLAQNAVQLALSRILVGCGEAGGTPNAHALVATYAPPEKRTRALALYSLGMPLGGLFGLLIGGVVLDHFGWRAAFLVAGAPGLPLALVAWLTLRDPPTRALDDGAQALGTAPALRMLARNRSFVLLAMGGAMVAFVNYGQAAFLAAFFFRNHHDGLTELAVFWNQLAGWSVGPAGALGLALGFAAGGGGVVGMLLGGLITDWGVKRDIRAYVDVQALAGLARIPCFLCVVFATDIWLALGASLAHQIFTSMAAPPAYASVQGLVPESLRSTASSVFNFGLTAIGLGFGALCIGLASDTLSHWLGPNEGLRWALACSEAILLCAALTIYAARHSFAEDTVS
ncbi:spinster family MFS transporter [Phenylobacterium sp.]|uniref:spinster family MFS transporter n=1 Tax=Phenylobacterium sp. TaxID=1871053 RepID=UPI0035B239F6